MRSIQEILRQAIRNTTVDALVTADHVERLLDDLTQALEDEGIVTGLPSWEPRGHRTRGRATLHLESAPLADGSFGVLDLDAQVELWLTAVYEEDSSAQEPGTYSPSSFYRYNLQMEGHTVEMDDSGTHMRIELNEPTNEES